MMEDFPGHVARQILTLKDKFKEFLRDIEASGSTPLPDDDEECLALLRRMNDEQEAARVTKLAAKAKADLASGNLQAFPDDPELIEAILLADTRLADEPGEAIDDYLVDLVHRGCAEAKRAPKQSVDDFLSSLDEQPEDAACLTCGRELGTDDPLSDDCGGDCLGCIRDIDAWVSSKPDTEGGGD
jgi:hypothetical protein